MAVVAGVASLFMPLGSVSLQVLCLKKVLVIVVPAQEFSKYMFSSANF